MLLICMAMEADGFFFLFSSGERDEGSEKSAHVRDRKSNQPPEAPGFALRQSNEGRLVGLVDIIDTTAVALVVGFGIFMLDVMEWVLRWALEIYDVLVLMFHQLY